MKKIIIIAGLLIIGTSTVFAQNYAPIIDYVYNHYGLPLCQDPDYFFNAICKRQDVIIQQNDQILSNLTKIEQQNDQSLTYQHYMLCIITLNPNAGSLPANYLVLHGIDCSLPKTTPSNYGTSNYAK